MTDISLQKLIETGAHFGHQARRWNPRMQPYLYGVQEGVHVFDLLKTKKALEQALSILKQASKEGKSILVVGTKKQAKDKLKQVASEAGFYCVTERWLGGTLTNFSQIRKSTEKLVDMKKKMAEGGYASYTKKERLLIEREIARLERFFGGIVGLDDLPDILVIVDVKRESAAVKEAEMKEIETIGIVDSNSDPTKVDYPIPMNDDATRALDYVLDLIKDAVLEGKGKKSSRTSSAGRKDSSGKKGKQSKSKKSSK